MTDVPLPCPFCGGAPNQQTDRAYWPKFRVFCDHGAEHAVFIGGDTQEAAIAAWNRRAHAAKDAEIAQLRADLIKSLADNKALRADAIDRQNNVVAPLRARVRMLEDARPEPNCRTCVQSNIQYGITSCRATVLCTNGDRYEPLQPIHLWKTA